MLFAITRSNKVEELDAETSAYSMVCVPFCISVLRNEARLQRILDMA